MPVNIIGVLRLPVSNCSGKVGRPLLFIGKLEAMARPKVWTQGDGDSTLVYTPSTTRAEEYMGL